MSVAEGSRVGRARKRAMSDQGINWSRVLTTVGIFVVLGAIMAGYYLQNYSGLTTRDQMDLAQISLNISTGKGFTTRFVRPLNTGLMNDIPSPLPEINHGPLYPYAVAAAFRFGAISDQVVVWISMIFGFLTLVGTFILGRMLFDWRTGILAALGMGISVFVLKAATSASEWPMAGFWFVLLMLAIAAHHKSSLSGRGWYFYVVASAILIGLLYMTHQALLFLLIPIAAYFAVTGRRRTQRLVLFLIITAIAVAPWAYRNAKLTGGSILGANAWDIMVDTNEFAGNTLYRSMDAAGPGITGVLLYPIEHFSSFFRKLMTGTSGAAGDLLPMLGMIILPLAVVSMLYKFRSRSANAVRGLTYVIAPILFICIALFSIDHNALFLFAPVAAVFGSAYFFLLLDAKKLHPVFWRAIVIGMIAITFWPALAQITWEAPDNNDPLRQASAILSQGDSLNIECMYTDVPWLAAWRNLRMNGVWLPKSDKDIEHLSLNGFGMRTIVLTCESRNLPSGEIWYRLFTNKLQRDYITDPDEVLDRVRAHSQKLGHGSEEAMNVKRFFNQSQRNSEVFEALKGFKEADLGPFASDEIQVYEAGS